jgi:hypothetical protein
VTSEQRAAKAKRHRHYVGDSDETRRFPCGKARNRGTSSAAAWIDVTCKACIETIPSRRERNRIRHAAEQAALREKLVRSQQAGTEASAKARAERKAEEDERKAAISAARQERQRLNMVARATTEAEREAREIRERTLCRNADCRAKLTAQEVLGVGECFDCLHESEQRSLGAFVAAVTKPAAAAPARRVGEV